MCGAHRAYRKDVDMVETPHPTETWYPIPHNELIDLVQKHMREDGITIVRQAHALSYEDLRYFGLMQIVTQKGKNSREYGMVVGLRNAHDKRNPTALVVGSAVFAAGNLQFSGEIKLHRKHTQHMMRDLPGVVQNAIGQLGALRKRQDSRIKAYKRTKLTQAKAHDLIIQALDARVISSAKICKVLDEWRYPQHNVFRKNGMTAWRLHNAFLEVLQGVSIFSLPSATKKLNVILDSATGLREIEEVNAYKVA